MLWMTQPAWPSNTWQILTSDYDTQSSFYGVKKACEPVHVQLDLSDYNVAIVNTTTSGLKGLLVRVNVYSLENKLLLHREETRDAGADAVTDAFQLELMPLFSSAELVLVKLELRNEKGDLLAENIYWLGQKSASYRRLNRIPDASLEATASSSSAADMVHVRVDLRNKGAVAALANKLTLLKASDGARILPAYYSDNYVSLLPGESREIEIEYPLKAGNGGALIAIRGWNLARLTVPVGPSARK
jgi:hypothetical protein